MTKSGEQTPNQALRAPLANETAEKIVLGTAMDRPEAWAEVSRLGADDFSNPIHKEIFAIMAALAEDGKGPTLPNVGVELEHRGKVDYFAHASDMLIFSTDKLAHHISSLREMGKRRFALLRFRLGQAYAEGGSTAAELSSWSLGTHDAIVADDNTEDLAIVTLDSIRAREQDFLWDPYLPTDQLIALYGPSHTAKSIIAMDWAARITTGADWPDRSPNRNGPGTVLMLAAGEDAQDTVLKPRFVLAGGNPSRLAIVQSVRRPDANGKIAWDSAAMDKDAEKLAKVLRQDPAIRMVIVDPITNHLGKVKTNFEEEVRPVLMKLKHIAEQRRVPIVMIGHMNRREKGTAALDKMLGARAFSGVPRTIYLTGPDNDASESEKHRFVMAHERGLAHKAWKYRTEIAEGQVDGASVRQVRVVWTEESDATGQDVVDTMTREEKQIASDLSEQLRSYLESQGGTATREECERVLGWPKGVNWTRIRDKAGVSATPNRGGTGGGSSSLWTLGRIEVG